MKIFNYTSVILVAVFCLSFIAETKVTHLDKPIFPIEFVNGQNVLPPNIDLTVTKEIPYSELPYSFEILKSVENGDIVGESDVTSTEKPVEKQKLLFNIVGMHKRECKFALRTIAKYEEYSKHISFIKKSSYNDGRVDFYLASSILPVKMRLSFKLPRMTSVGKYPLVFDNGFLMGLTGFINVTEQNNRCLFYSTVYWEGGATGFSNMTLELFSSMLSHMALNTLLKMSN